MNPNFPSSFRPLNQEEQAQPSAEKVEFPSSFKPIDMQSQYEKDRNLIWEDSGDMERGVERGTAMATSRLLEGALGTPGNIQSAIKGITGI